MSTYSQPMKLSVGDEPATDSEESDGYGFSQSRRRFETLRALFTRTGHAGSMSDICRAASDVLASNSIDIPFALIYLLEEGGTQLRLAASTGIEPGTPVSPVHIDLAIAAEIWPFRELLSAERGSILYSFPKPFVPAPDQLASAPSGALMGEQMERAFVMPLADPEGGPVTGFMVVGLPAAEEPDSAYREFLELVAAQVGTSLQHALPPDTPAVVTATAENGSNPAGLDTLASTTILSYEEMVRALGAINDSLAVFDREWRYIYVNEGAAMYLGKRPADLLGRVVWEMYPALVGTPFHTELLRAVEGETPVSFETYYGEFRGWYEIHAYPFGSGVSVMARAINDRKSLEEALRLSEQRYRSLADAVQQMIWRNSPEGRTEYYNVRWQEYTGCDADLHKGSGWVNTIHPDDRATVAASRGVGLATGEAYTFEYRVRRHDGVYRWHLTRVTPVKDAEGNLLSWVGTATDIHDLKCAQERSRFLAEASAILAESPDYEHALERIAELAVPSLADMFAVNLADEDGGIEGVAFAHADKEAGKAFIRMRRGDPSVRHDGVMHVLATGESKLADELPDDLMISLAQDAEHLEMLRALKFGATLSVPLMARGRAFGVLTLVTGAGRRFEQEDVLCAEDLAHRVALAIDNSRLNEAAQQAARQHTETLALVDALLEVAPIGIGFLDTDLRYIRVNQTLASFNGLGVEDHLGRRPSDILPERAPEFERILRRVTETGEPVLNMNLGGVLSDGEAAHWLASCYPVVVDGQMLGLGVILMDVTEARAQEDLLRASESRFRRMIESNMIGAGFWSADGRIIDGNDALVRMLGYTREEMQRGEVYWSTITPPEYKARNDRSLEELRDRGVSTPYEKIYIARDGSSIPVLISASTFDEETPDAGSFFVIDLSEQKRTEAALRASREQLQIAFEAAELGMWDWDVKADRITWSGEHERLFGLQPGTFGGTREEFFNALYPADREMVAQAIRRSMTERKDYDEEFRVAWPDGSVHWVAAKGRFLYDDDGKPIRMAGAVMEVTARKEAEQRLRESEARFRRMVESNTFGVAFGDFSGRITYANDAFLEMVGYSREDLASGELRWDEMTPPEFLVLDAKAGDEMMLRGVATPFEKEYIRKDGRRVPILIGGALLNDPNAEENQIATFYLDLTERKRADEELRKAKEVAEAANRAKDQFLAMLSHELRTPLTPVLAMVESLESDPELPESMRAGLALVHRNVDLEARLIDDLLDLTRITKGKLQLRMERVDVHRLLYNVLDICRDEIERQELHVLVDLRAANCHTNADPARLQQVLWNLVKNAIKFTPYGGAITIHTENTAEGKLLVELIDTGIGIAPENLARIFNSFEQGDRRLARGESGLGLGLAISKMVVELHGGTLTAASEGSDQGATFTLLLDALQPADILPASVGSGTRSGARDDGEPLPRILMVEDHLDTSRVLRFFLERNGYVVTVAHTIGSALELLEAETFDLLVSDIGLPDGHGTDLLERTRGRLRMPAIALSGFGMESDIRRSKDAGFIEHLTKPISGKRLLEVIHRVLPVHS